MIRRLRRRFFLLCAGMTGSVLLLLMAALGFVVEQEYREMSLRGQQEVFKMLESRLQQEREIENAWLGRLERENRLIIAITDNGIPLHFPGGWQPQTPRAALLKEAAGREEEKGPFLLKGEQGENYRCMDGRVAVRQGEYMLTLLFHLWEEEKGIRLLRGRFLLAGAAGLLALATFSFWLAKLAVRPTEESIREQNAFIAAAGHELRSPLAAMGASASAILADPPGTERYVRAIAGECRRLGRLTDDLLLLTRTDTPGFTLQSAEVFLDTLLIETAEGMRPAVRERGHRLLLCLPDEEELPAVFGDALRLQQAVENLILNAACYAGGKGEIALSAAREGKMVRIAVTDHGKGIEDEEKERVFLRFARGDSARSDRSHSGLGLSIVQEIIRLHGGEITLEDTPGGGCTFILRLPAAKHKGRPG